MSTNFYWKQTGGATIAAYADGTQIPVSVDGMDPRIHIGKRSAAGLYCWDCGVSLCKGGEAGIHYSKHDWYDACPKCGKTRTPSDRIAGPVAVELGFAKPAQQRPSGVEGCASFSWAQDPERVRAICAARPSEALVVNEYGDESTGAEFLAMLEINCPVQSTEWIGVAFS